MYEQNWIILGSGVSLLKFNYLGIYEARVSVEGFSISEWSIYKTSFLKINTIFPQK